MVKRFGEFTKSSLILLLGGFLLTGFLATSIASYYVSKASIRQTVLERELPLSSDNIYSEIQRILLPPLNISETMANSVFLRDWILAGEQDINKITDYLTKIKVKQGMTAAFLASERTLNYYSYQGLRNRIDPANGDEWFAQCKAGQPDFEINADLDDHVTNQMTLFINYKVFDYNGNFIGITGVATQIESIKALISRFKTQYHKTIYFVSPTGRVAFRDGADPLKKPELALYLGSAELAAELLSTDASTLEYENEGRDVLLNARFLPELHWYLVVEEEVSDQISHLRHLLAMNLAICLFITLLVLSIVYLTVHQYQKQLRSQHRTVSRQAQELSEKNQCLEQLHHEKDEFLKWVVHDLKTPLAGITGLAQLLPEENDQARIREYAEAIEESGAEMMDFIQTLLDVKAAESAGTPRLETVLISQLLMASQARWNVLAKAKSLQLHFEGLDDSASIVANNTWIKTIVDNLVSNAIKYSPAQAIVIVQMEQIRQSVRIWVIDQGVGISLKDQPLLFKQFSRLSSQPTAGESSNGLGLYIVKNMTEKLGGTVGVESELGHGSRFWVEFPLIDESKKESAELPQTD
jgi:signal transduction histidine kinase